MVNTLYPIICVYTTLVLGCSGQKNPGVPIDIEEVTPHLYASFNETEVIKPKNIEEIRSDTRRFLFGAFSRSHWGGYWDRLQACYSISMTIRTAEPFLRKYFEKRYLYANTLEYEIGFLIHEIIHKYQIVLELYKLTMSRFVMKPELNMAPVTFLFYMYSLIVEQCTAIIHLCHMLHETPMKYQGGYSNATVEGVFNEDNRFAKQKIKKIIEEGTGMVVYEKVVKGKKKKKKKTAAPKIPVAPRPTVTSQVSPKTKRPSTTAKVPTKKPTEQPSAPEIKPSAPEKKPEEQPSAPGAGGEDENKDKGEGGGAGEDKGDDGVKQPDAKEDDEQKVITMAPVGDEDEESSESEDIPGVDSEKSEESEEEPIDPAEAQKQYEKQLEKKKKRKEREQRKISQLWKSFTNTKPILGTRKNKYNWPIVYGWSIEDW